MADRDDIDRLYETLERVRERVHALSVRVRALEWRAEQARRERRLVLGLPSKIAAVVVTTAAVYAAISVLLQHVR